MCLVVVASVSVVQPDVVERSGLALVNIQTHKYCRHTVVQVSNGLVELVEHQHHVGDLVRDQEHVVGVGDGGGWVLVGQLRSKEAGIGLNEIQL